MYNKHKVHQFMKKLKDHECGPEEAIAKLEAFEHALSFIRLRMLNEDNEGDGFQKCNKMTETLKRWQTTLMKLDEAEKECPSYETGEVIRREAESGESNREWSFISSSHTQQHNPEQSRTESYSLCYFTHV